MSNMTERRARWGNLSSLKWIKVFYLKYFDDKWMRQKGFGKNAMKMARLFMKVISKNNEKKIISLRDKDITLQ